MPDFLLYIQEKWNFSVSQHNLDLKPGLEDLCGGDNDTDEEEDEAFDDLTSSLSEVFKAVVSDGIICSVDKEKPEVRFNKCNPSRT